jgi:dsDNA-binding SOS-regulon protein
MGPGALKKFQSRIRPDSDDSAAFIGFQEWFYFDYRLDTGDRIIDLFAQEVAPDLPTSQRKILKDWLATNRQRLLETLKVEPGVGETMQDMLSGEVLHLKDISYSYVGSRWLVFLGRTLLTEGRWCFTGTGNLLSPLEKEDLVAEVKRMWAR